MDRYYTTIRYRQRRLVRHHKRGVPFSLLHIKNQYVLNSVSILELYPSVLPRKPIALAKSVRSTDREV